MIIKKYYSVITLILIFMLLYVFYKPKLDLEKFMVYLPKRNVQRPLMKSLDYFRRDKTYCEELMEDWTKFQTSPKYTELFPTLELEKSKLPKGEGGSDSFVIESMVLHHLATQPSVKTVCETGFNFGYSSFNFLSANPNLHVYSFDIGQHDYVLKMNETLHKFFPDNRHHLTLGNSLKTISESIESGKLPLCDLIYVDGGHTYNVAKSDIIQFGSHASDNNAIVFDDYPTNWGQNIGKAWNELTLSGNITPGEEYDYENFKSQVLSKKVVDISAPLSDLEKKFGIIELVRCGLKNYGSLQRGFVVGSIVKV